MDYININWRKKMYEMIKDFKRLSPPPAEKVAEMMEQIRIIKNAMGYKYRLSRPMPKIKQEK